MRGFRASLVPFQRNLVTRDGTACWTAPCTEWLRSEIVRMWDENPEFEHSAVLLEQGLGGGHAPGLLEEVRKDVPVGVLVEVDPDPAGLSHVRRIEEALRVVLEHHALVRRAGLHPDAVPSFANVGLAACPHREELVLHAKSRRAPRLHFVRLGKGERDLAELREYARDRGRHARNV